ncbi:MAG: cardiolipin synthase [Gemmatimonadota bacterium]
MELWPYLAGGVVALLAVSASAHAILTQRNVGTAIAWVGVIWLSPVVGMVVYLLLGINRIHRDASQIRADAARYEATSDLPHQRADALAEELGPEHGHLAMVARLGDRLINRPLLPGNLIVPLLGGDQAYPEMLAAIRAARHSVALATYIFDNDRAGSQFLEALKDAVARGVEVRVLIDDMGARYSFPSMVKALRREEIPVARFLRTAVPWRTRFFNLRNHRKIMVVDGRVGFTGGMNIREGSWLELQPKHPTRDIHFRVEGPVVAELQEVFAEDWTFTTRERLQGNAWFPPLTVRGETSARGLSDGPDVDFEKLQGMILGALSAARRSVRIVTPYFIPSPELLTLLNLAAMRGVDVQIMLPQKSNLPLVQWASTAYWAQLLEKGCSIRLTAPPFDHGKLMLVDGCWVLLGSANLDPRSLQLNFEFNVECYDRSLAEDLGAWVAEREAGSREVTLAELRRRPLPSKLRDGLARLLSPYL